MDKSEIKAIKEHIKALQETQDVQLARQVDAYFSGVMAGYQLGKEEKDAKISDD